METAITYSGQIEFLLELVFHRHLLLFNLGLRCGGDLFGSKSFDDSSYISRSVCNLAFLLKQ
jgi:hypothetical protein